jgi:PAS domain S-box-containing protein
MTESAGGGGQSRRAGPTGPSDLSAEAFRAIFEDAGIGIAIVGRDGRPITTNRRLQEILGFSDDEMRSRTFTDITHPDDREETRAWAERLLRGEVTRYQLDKRYVRKDLQTVDVRLTVSLVRQPDGSPVWGVGMVEDVTELHRIADERKRLRARLAHAQEEERRRLAEDLHDGPVQKFTAAGLRAGSLAQSLTDAADAEQAIHVQEALGEGIRGLRRLIFDLRPPALDNEGLGEAVRQQLERLKAETGWRTTIVDDLDAQPAEEIASALYRIIQEALTNVRKHASAREVSVHLGSDTERVRGSVADNGAGFDVERASHDRMHLGLASMRERAALFGGWCRIESSPGAGTTVRFDLPLSPGPMGPDG